jgi:hypothetical protein
MTVSTAPSTDQFDELAFLRRICKTLDGLDDKRRERCVGYLFDRYLDQNAQVSSVADAMREAIQTRQGT